MKEVEVEERSRTRIIRIRRADTANALGSVVMTEMGNLLASFETDPGVRAVIITGEGDRAFCSGMDLKEFARTGRQVAPSSGPGLAILLDRVYPKPVLAAVNGAAVAGGFEIVLACDFVVAAPHATFALPQVRRGLVAGANGLSLAHRIPRVRAMEMALTGAPLGAAQALAYGLVNRVVPAGEVLDATLEIATLLEQAAPGALAVTKRGMVASPRLESEVAAEIAAVFAGDEAREGATAFLEKRSPAWATDGSPRKRMTT